MPPEPGLDAAQHAASQQIAHQAEALRDTTFAVMMSTALPCDKLYAPDAFKVFLDQLIVDAGDPSDPIERLLLQQLALAHFRVGDLQMSAAGATSTEAAKVYNACACRLLGEFRRTALALRVYRARVPEASAEIKLKVRKLAQ